MENPFCAPEGIFNLSRVENLENPPLVPFVIAKVVQLFGKLLPNCFTALRLAEKGAEQPLSLSEKMLLKYNSPLCPHCSCSERPFRKAMQRLEAAEVERRGGLPRRSSSQ